MLTCTSLAPRLAQPARVFALSAIVELGAGGQQLACACAAVGRWVVDGFECWSFWLGVVACSTIDEWHI